MKITFLLLAIFFCLFLFSCPPDTDDRDYRQDMRDFVQNISVYTKAIDGDFIIIPQNGHELYTKNGEPDGSPDLTYLGAIDGVGREDLFYGYEDDDIPTPAGEAAYMMKFLDSAEAQGVEALVTDYCFTPGYVDTSYQENSEKSYISFAADSRELDTIPVYPVSLYHENESDIYFLSGAQNFLYLINPEQYTTKDDYLTALEGTNYDVLIIDLFFEDMALLPSNVASLKQKSTGHDRLVIAYMSIGEAEDYRYYWETLPSALIAGENQDWEGNYIVRYWEEEWQEIIFGNDDSYVKKIMDAGFDGVYLDIIDAYEYFE
ncbi:MAG: endo alpha-1,4 polygalactosaminidase [Spirochaetales bacterium]|nr:endo alpha-1,4 polygalactosaminidase [Spirochaetales bacterium]